MTPPDHTPDPPGPASVVASWASARTGVHLTLLDLDGGAWPPESCRAILDDGERAAADRLATLELATRFVRRRAAVRHLLAERTGDDPARLPLAVAPGGKPFVPGERGGVTFNVSHSRNLCIVAVGTGVAIGVDIEHLGGRRVTAEMLALVLGPAERAELARHRGPRRALQFTRAWTRKEAMVKATGTGLAVPLTDLRVDMTAAWQTAEWATVPAPDGRGAHGTAVTYVDLSDAQPGVCGALMAIRGGTAART